MAKDRPKKPRARLFIALELDDGTRDALAAWQSALVLAARGELRPAAPETLHLTLAFLGYRFEREIATIAGCLDDAWPRPVALAFAVEAAPRPAGRPRFYAAPVNGGEALAALRAELVATLTTTIGFADERRAFWPHVTLCRVKSRVRRHAVPSPLPPAPAALAEPRPAVALTLFKSELLPSGARHTALATAPLPAAAQ